MKKVLIIFSAAVILIIVFIQIKNVTSARSDTIELAIENRFKILDKEMDLHLQLIGRKIPVNSESKSNKIVFVQLDKNNKTYDFRKDLQSAMEYYIEKREDSLTLAGLDLLYLKRNESYPILTIIRENFEDEIEITTDSLDLFSIKFSLPERGAIVLLLNNSNVCLYAYYLEQNNARKILENSPVIFNLIKNLK